MAAPSSDERRILALISANRPVLLLNLSQMGVR